jgi:hypothetical protein
MGTKNTSTTQNQYNPQGMANYNAFQGLTGGILSNWATNPYGNAQFSQNLSQNMGMANQSNMNAISNSMSQFNMTGMNNAPSGARTQLMSSLGRFGSANNANAFYQAVNTANNRQTGAVGQMSSFQPLQTGGTTTQQTSGLGTWLPQLLGAAGGAALGVATGGLSTLAGGMANSAGFMGSGMGANSAGFSSMAPPTSQQGSPNAFSNSMMTQSGMPGIPTGGSAPNFVY